MVPLLLFFASVLAHCFAQQNIHITNYTTETGSFSSPNYGSDYPSNSSYRWYIEEAVGKYITLTFDNFAVEGYANVPCKYDWVIVVEGSDIGDMKDCSLPPSGVPVAGFFCNYHLPPVTLALNSNVAAIQFCSDVVIEDKGFQISWETMDTPPIGTTEKPTSPTPPPLFTNCSLPFFGINTDETYELTSPNYPPGPYPNNANCTWVVTVKADILKVRTTFFDVEGYSNQCYYDRLTITDQYGQSTIYCMNRGPDKDYPGDPPFMITFNFVSDDEIQFPGFDLMLTGANSTVPPPVDSKCNQTFLLATGESIMLYSPGWPYDYRNNENCGWKIINNFWNQNYSIQFLFMDFNTELNFDQLTVVLNDGITKTYDGVLPKNTTAVFPTSNLTATFITDNDVVGRGFDIVVTLVPNPFYCPPQTFRCRHPPNMCIPMSQFCNGGPPDCPDGSDESAVICRLNATCGVSNVKPNINVPHGNIFIVNGTQAKPFSWPWMVGIYRKSVDFFMCGGTLIEPRWVLTSARCLAGDSGDPYQLKVKIGSYEQHATSAHEQDTNVTSIILHPQYNKVTLENDIALLLLEDVIQLNNYTNVACMPTTEYVVPQNSKCVVTGWGPTQNTGNNTVLRQMLAYIIPDNVCNDTDHYNGHILDSQICAGDDRGFSGICQGDFGGPLACPDSGDRYYVQGVASQNDGRSNCVAPHKPGIYSRTSAFMDFILQTMEEYNKI